MSDPFQNDDCGDHCITMSVDHTGFRAFGNLSCARLPSHLQHGFVRVGTGAGGPGMTKGVTPAARGHGSIAIKSEPAVASRLEPFARRLVARRLGRPAAGNMS